MLATRRTKIHQINQPKVSSMSFLPHGYQSPKPSNNFMKLVDGENKIRILTAPVLGWEDWVDQKPVRYGMVEKPKHPHDPKKPIKHFWSFVVWNYNDETIQILHITQASIRNAIEALCNDKDWGAPYFYDIKVVKRGEKMDTEYTVNPVPHKPTSQYIVDMFNEKRCNLDAIFNNDDPFDKSHHKFTDGIFDDNSDFCVDVITVDQAMALHNVLGQCEESYRVKVMEFLKKNHGVMELTKLTPEVYKNIYSAAVKKAEPMSIDDIDRAVL